MHGIKKGPEKLLTILLCQMLLSLGALVGITHSQPRQAPDKAFKFSLPDVTGRLHAPAEFGSSKAAVFFFIATECPISNRYAPEISSIVEQYSKQNFSFYAVHSEQDLDREVARKHASDFGYQIPVLLDPAQTLASTFGVTMTPTVAVISPRGEVLYRGRIDNRYLDFGTFRNAGITSDLRIALDNLLKGRPIAARFTKGVGCAIPTPSSQGSSERDRR